MRSPISIIVLALMILVAPPIARATASNVSVTVTGPEQLVYSYQRDRCDKIDIPDYPLRAVRLKNGGIIAFAGNERNFPFIGPSLLALKHSCSSVLDSARDPNPANYDYMTWIAAPWTQDGRTIHALIHVEFHAEMIAGDCHSNKKAQQEKSFECWYSASTYAVSNDSGQHFHIPKPVHLVAAPPFTQDFDQVRPRGFFGPSNIVETDDAFYTLIFTPGEKSQRRGVCLFRLLKSGQPWNWKAYDGKEFTISAVNPYLYRGASPKPCQPVGPFSSFVMSIVKHLASGLFIATFTMVGNSKLGIKGGVGYAVSKDLINWSKKRMLIELPGKPPQNCDGPGYEYPSILDAGSQARNFDSVGNNAWLFLTKLHIFKCGNGLNRDLVRLPIRINAE